MSSVLLAVLSLFKRIDRSAQAWTLLIMITCASVWFTSADARAEEWGLTVEQRVEMGGTITGMQLSEDGQNIAVTDRTGTLYVYETEGMKQVLSQRFSKDNARVLGWIGRYLLTQRHNKIMLWRTRDWRVVDQWVLQDGQEVLNLHRGEDGDLRIAVSQLGLLLITVKDDRIQRETIFSLVPEPYVKAAKANWAIQLDESMFWVSRNETGGLLGEFSDGEFFNSPMGTVGMGKAVYHSGSPWIYVYGEGPVIEVRHAMTYQTLTAMQAGWSNTLDLALSADGQLLMATGVGGDVKLWHTRSMQLVASLSVNTTESAFVSFSKDGQHIYVASDKKLMRASLAALKTHMSKNQHGVITEAMIKSAWEKMLGEDTVEYAEARLQLALGGAESIKFIAQNLKAGEDHSQEIKQLVQQLNAEEFVKRERATKRLTEIGKAAEPALKTLLENTESTEARWRAEQILNNIAEDASDVSLTRVTRASMVLACIGTREAYQVMEGLVRRLEADREQKNTESYRSMIQTYLWMKQLYGSKPSTTPPGQ